MSDNIIYEPHPVSPERVEILRAQGFVIVDAIYDPNRWAKKPAPVDQPAPEPAPARRGPGRPRKEPVTDGA